MNIYDFAMKMEKDGESFYRDLAKKCGTKGLANILTMLADEEVKHYELMKRMKDKTPKPSETTILTDVKNIFAKMADEGGKLDLTLSQKELYKKAQELEKQSEDFYASKSKEVAEKEKKEIFKGLADEERKHYYILDNIIEFISRPETWLENAEFNHLEDY